MKQPIAITGLSAISSSGKSSYETRPVRFSSSAEKATADKSKPDRSLHNSGYESPKHHLSFDQKLNAWVGKLPETIQKQIKTLQNSTRNYKNLDPSVLYAIYTAREAVKQAGWAKGANFGINIGSSRGATQLFEKYYSAFLPAARHGAEENKSSTLASPTTTLGNISSWVAQDLQNNGPEISHSITCSTALHSLLNGVAWLRSGMCDKFLVGGSEAALTSFTIAQMRALGVLTSLPAGRHGAEKEVSTDQPKNDLKTPENKTKNPIFYPCRALDLDKTENTMVLGEGSGSVCLELGGKENALAYIAGVGYATEKLKHAVSISAEAECFQKSMKMAVEDKISASAEVDAIVMHAPGTILGDSSEFKAIQAVFGEKMPFLTTNKWNIGHTFGASGLLSLDLAIHMLQTQQLVEVPFISPQGKPKKLETVLVNAVGFGGNAVSVLLRKA